MKVHGNAHSDQREGWCWSRRSVKGTPVERPTTGGPNGLCPARPPTAPIEVIYDHPHLGDADTARIVSVWRVDSE